MEKETDTQKVLFRRYPHSDSCSLVREGNVMNFQAVSIDIETEYVNRWDITFIVEEFEKAIK